MPPNTLKYDQLVIYTKQTLSEILEHLKCYHTGTLFSDTKNMNLTLSKEIISNNAVKTIILRHSAVMSSALFIYLDHSCIKKVNIFDNFLTEV